MKFDLTIEEANLVLIALSKLPYESVATLIAKLQKQAQEQANANRPNKAPVVG